MNIADDPWINDPLLAETYDQNETKTWDVELIQTLLRNLVSMKILECFSGTGRILIPLACDGHTIVGIDLSETMTARAMSKIAALSKEIRDRVTFIVGDALVVEWGSGYDVVILGGNCLFELSSAEAQEECIRRSSVALVHRGYVFVDNDDALDGKPVDASIIGMERTWEGTGADGTYIRCLSRTVDVDVNKGVEYCANTWYKHTADGIETTFETTSASRPVSADEVETWLRKHGFEILRGTEGGRATFWARKR